VNVPGSAGGNELGQVWLVARRELRERARSRAFRASVVVMVLVVAAVVVVPSFIDGRSTAWDIGVTGDTPAGFAEAVEAQATTFDATVKVLTHATPAGGEDAVRSGDVDVLVIDADRLEWRRLPDERLRSVVTAALQLLAIQERATQAGISPEQMAAITAPVTIESVQLGRVVGRTTDDEMAALIMNVVLLMVIATFGALVLTGVVEEKSSRVVEVLLARVRPRTLLSGKVLGIGLLGLFEVAMLAAAALIARSTVDDVDLPATRGSVLAWALVWFVLGYAFYAVVYGALGSLASRSEDAQSVTGPVTVLLMAGYWVSFIAIGSPETAWAKAVSFLPPTAPFAMPSRVAMGATAWWEPILAVVVALATIRALIGIGGRLYAVAILHSGPTLKIRQAWTRSVTPSEPKG
jgi:ABC-2 type transport system permease protein